MVETIMLFSLGFLAGCLLMVVFAPLVHQRAVRLTTQSILAATPMTMAEMQADKDRLRAEFAMVTRRLEIDGEEMRTRIGNQLAEIGQKVARINRLKDELASKGAVIMALQARERARKSMIGRIVRLLRFLLVRSHRSRGSAPLGQLQAQT